MIKLDIIGAPVSAGAYSPGQEKAPKALRDAGLIQKLRERNFQVDDLGDISKFRWKNDIMNPFAMNSQEVVNSINELAPIVKCSLNNKSKVLVLGGDCTVEIGTVSGAISHEENTGLIYIDLDADLNTPLSTTDGALDWMGVAHMLGIHGTLNEISNIGPTIPLLKPEQIFLFGLGNVKVHEREIISDIKIPHTTIEEIQENPSLSAAKVINGWGKNFSQLLIHLDVDILDFTEIPIAENTRRNMGLKLDQLMNALRILLLSPKFSVLTITEINPDHGEEGVTINHFVNKIVDVLGYLSKNRNMHKLNEK